MRAQRYGHCGVRGVFLVRVEKLGRRRAGRWREECHCVRFQPIYARNVVNDICRNLSRGHAYRVCVSSIAFQRDACRLFPTQCLGMQA